MAQLPLLTAEFAKANHDGHPTQQALSATGFGAPTMVTSDNLAWMRTLQSESMQLIVTSPPYNIGKEYEKKQSLQAYLDAQSRVIEESVRLLRPIGSICWQVGNHVVDSEIVPLDIVLFPIFRSLGLKLRNRIIGQLSGDPKGKNPGDSVFDPYMGVGSTVIAAVKHGRDGYGCDLEQRYVDIAWERVEALLAGTLKMRPMGKPIYDPTLPNGGHQ